MHNSKNPWLMRLTLVNNQTGQKASIVYPNEKVEFLESLDQCQIPYGSGAYSHLATSPYGVQPDSLQMEMTRMIEDISGPPSIRELNHLGEQIQKMSQEGRRAYERELQRYIGLDIKTAINAAHYILYDGVVYDGESLADRAVLAEEQEPLLRIQLVSEDIGWNDDPNTGIWLDCPAGERELKAVAQAMGVSSVDELMVNDIAWNAVLGDTYLWEAHENLTRCSDINRMASALKAQGGMAQAAKFKSVLMMESCCQFDKAADIAERLDQYEFYRTSELCDRVQQAVPDAQAGELAENLGFEETDYGYIRKAGPLTLDEQLHGKGPEFQSFFA